MNNNMQGNNMMMGQNMMGNNMMGNNMMGQNMQNMQHMPNMQQNTGPSISSMGGGTPITQLRRDVASVSRPTSSNDELSRTESDRDERIKYIVEDINNNIDESRKNKKKVKKDSETDTDTEESEKEEIKKKKKKSNNSSFGFNIPDMVKDPILIWLIYMLMSQNFFKKLIGNYITLINPTDEGVVPLTGIAVYGVILVSLYSFIKLILKQLNKY
jgi:hypothetical protein